MANTTTAHKIDDNTYLITTSVGDQFMVSDKIVTRVPIPVSTTALTACPFQDLYLDTWIDNAKSAVNDIVLDQDALSNLLAIVKLKTEIFE